MGEWTANSALDFLLKHSTSDHHHHDWEYLRRSQRWSRGGYAGEDGWHVRRCRLCGLRQSFIEAHHASPERVRPLSAGEQARYPIGPDRLRDAEEYIRGLDTEAPEGGEGDE